MVSLTHVIAALSVTAAWPQAPPPLTVAEALSWVIGQNPRLSALAREVAAAEEGVNAARALTNPEVLLVPGVTSPSGSDEELLIQQPLEINGVRKARSAVAAAQLDRVRAEALGELRSVIFETKTAYYELARAQRLQLLTEEALRTAEAFDRGVKRQVEEGLKPGVDGLQTGIEVSRARQRLALAQAEVQIAAAALNAVRGQLPQEPIGALPEPIFEPSTMDRESALAQALSARADLAAAEIQRDELLHQARLARAEGRPDLVPHLRAESVVRGLRGVGFGLGISLPFFDHGGRRARRRQAERLASAQECRIEAAANQVRQEVEQALLRLQAADAVIREYQNGVLDQAGRLLDANLKGFQLGAPGTSVLTVLEAQHTHRSVQTEYLHALVDHALARAELDRATGAVSAELLALAALRQ